MNLFCNLKSDWSLVPGQFCFWYLFPLKGTGFKRKKKVNFIKVFGNPLSKYLIFKIISRIQWLFWVVYQIKKGPGTSFWCTFPAWFFHKNVSYLIFYQWTKFQCHIFLPSQYIKQNVLLSSYLDSWWLHKL